jgi:glycine/D-amino acid oxidase-like deaminating enzyme
MIDATPDVVPVMDEISDCPGLFLATGFSGHGFGIGPSAGKVMADLVTGEDPGYDLTRFRFSRFSDGSKMRPGPAI